MRWRIWSSFWSLFIFFPLTPFCLRERRLPSWIIKKCAACRQALDYSTQRRRCVKCKCYPASIVYCQRCRAKVLLSNGSGIIAGCKIIAAAGRRQTLACFCFQQYVGITTTTPSALQSKWTRTRRSACNRAITMKIGVAIITIIAQVTLATKHTSNWSTDGAVQCNQNAGTNIKSNTASTCASKQICNFSRDVPAQWTMMQPTNARIMGDGDLL